MSGTIASAHSPVKRVPRGLPSSPHWAVRHLAGVPPQVLDDGTLRLVLPAHSGRVATPPDDPPGYSDRVTRLIGAGEAGNQHPESPQVQACHRGGTFAGNHSLRPVRLPSAPDSLTVNLRSGRCFGARLPRPHLTGRYARCLLTPRPIRLGQDATLMTPPAIPTDLLG